MLLDCFIYVAFLFLLYPFFCHGWAEFFSSSVCLLFRAINFIVIKKILFHLLYWDFINWDQSSIHGMATKLDMKC